MTAQTRSYAHPPIHEALVEFRFEEPERWDPTVPGLMVADEVIASRYDGQRDDVRTFQASLMVNLEHGQNNLAFGQQPSKVRFSNQERTRLLLMGPETLSVHCVREYPGWDTFRGHIEQALSAHDTIIESRAVTRIGVRYINRIPIPSLDVPFSNYLASISPPHLNIQGARTGYMDASEYHLDDPVCRLVIQQSSQQHDGQYTLVLDIDTITVWDEPLTSRPDILSHVDALHELVVDVFERSITQETREQSS